MAELTDRLHEASKEIDKKTLIDVLLKQKPYDLSPQRLAEKNSDELSGYIANYISRKGVNTEEAFANKLYRSFTPKREKGIDGRKARKYSLLTIIDGISYADNIPDQALTRLDGWEAIYFLAGVYHSRTSRFIGDRYTQKNLKSWGTEEIIARTIQKGIEKLNNVEKRIGKTLPHRKQVEGECYKVIHPQPKLF